MRRRRTVHTEERCPEEKCASGASCVSTERGAACLCAGAWGGAHCDRYVGHDHACVDRCAPPLVCLWGTHESGAEVYCACVAGAACTPPGPGGASGALWVALVLALVAALCAVLGVMHRRRRSGFAHARLSSNLEISNPMFLADEEELAPSPQVGGAHFANPLYDTGYVPAPHNQHDHANLLRSRGTPSSSGLERAALL